MNAVENLRGIGWALFSVCVSSIMTISVRALAEAFSPAMILMMRAGISLFLLAMILLLLTRYRYLFAITAWPAHTIRGLCIAVSTLLGFYALATIPIATATVLFFTAPVFAVLISAVFQGETVGLRRWSAVIAGFCGALIILRPGLGTFNPDMLAAIASSIFFATALTLSRRVAGADGPVSAFATSVVMTSIFAFPFALPVWELPTNLPLWALVIVLVVTGGARNIADIQAYRYGDAGVVGPIAYLRLIIVGVAGFIWFDEVPDAVTIIGALIIISATLYIAQRERQLGRQSRGSSA